MKVEILPIAVGLTVGILADAFLVRMTLIPALMAALGERAWWLPALLERQLPVIDVEGEGLERTLEHEAWTAAHGPAVLRAQDLMLADDEGPYEYLRMIDKINAITSEEFVS